MKSLGEIKMKKFYTVLGLFLALASLSLTAKPAQAKDFCDFIVGDTNGWGALALTTTFGPFGVTTGIVCFGAVWQGAEFDHEMLKREAAMALEENKIYQPSWLAPYAQTHNFNSLEEAASDVLKNGIQQ